MKSTYKLLGFLWDGAPLFADYHRVHVETNRFQDYRQPINLFDLIEGRKRSIPLSDILSLEEERSLDSMFRQLDDCCELVIVRDILLSGGNKTLDAFLERKESQVLEFIRTRLPGTVVSVAVFECGRHEDVA